MLFQLHWQNRANLKQTEMVAQGDFNDPEKLHAWTKELVERRGNEMPEGWCTMICTEDSPYFWMATTPTPKK